MQDFAALRPQPRRPGGRQRPAVRGDAAQRQARPGPRSSTTATTRYLAGFVQDDWRVTPQLTLNLGLRYELDTDVKNISRLRRHQPDRAAVPAGRPQARPRQLRPRASASPGSSRGGRTAASTAGYGIYYDRVTLEIVSLERGLDGRALPIEVRAGQRVLPRPRDGQRAALRAHLRESLHRLHPARAPAPRASTSSTTRWRTPTVQQFNLGAEARLGRRPRAASWTASTTAGTHFIIGRTIGHGLQPGGGRARPRGEPRVERGHAATTACSSPLEKRWGRAQACCAVLHAGQGPQLRERRPDPVRERAHRPERPRARVRPDAQRAAPPRHARRARSSLPGPVRVSPLWTVASGVPMDILMPDASTRVPTLQRNAGGPPLQDRGRAERLPAPSSTRAGGVDGVLLPLVSDDARFSDSFQLARRAPVARASRSAPAGALEAHGRVLQRLQRRPTSWASRTSNYSGFANVLVRDSDDPSSPATCARRRFGQRA